jgi:2-C-methyl-D-erythritol 4-phosphate cytidylyltransferase/2-C-methyl-D-erythritol 2,4-cyclodiphosphate synthase
MGTDKLWIDVWGRPLWRWSLDTLLGASGLERVAIAVPPEGVDRYRAALPAGDERCLVIPGGDARADSVIAGIWALTGVGYDDAALVLVHDAARPAITTELIEAVASAVASVDGAVIPIVPLVDSLKRVRGDRVVAPVERDEVVGAQTPQAARLGALRAAIEESHAWGRPITDDAGALAAAGVPVHVVPGDPANRKVTEPADVISMRAQLAARAFGISREPGGTAAGHRTGVGFDAHRLVADIPLRLGGLAFPDEPRGLEGHSDGDVVLHALVDALLGAAALGDVGAMFPEEATPPGADSAELLHGAVARLHAAGWRPSSADVAVAAARPAIAPRRDELRARLADLLEVPIERVSVKGSTSDGLGILAADGIAAWAVATIEPTG